MYIEFQLSDMCIGNMEDIDPIQTYLVVLSYFSTVARALFI